MAEELDVLSTPVTPSWWTELQNTYRAGTANVFVLHGAVADYVEHPSTNLTLREYLEQRLLRLHAVATFAPDQGVTFPGTELVAKESRAWVERVLGIEQQDESAADAFNPLAALAAAGAAVGAGNQGKLPDDAPSAIDKLIEWARGATIEEPGVPQRVVGRGEARRAVGARAAIIVERADLIVPPEDKARLGPTDRRLLAILDRAGRSIEINRNKALVIILAPSLEDIHPDLRTSTSGIRTIEVGVPDVDQRLAFIARTLPDRRAELDGLTEMELANETAGLGRRHIEDIAMRAAANGGRLTREMVKERKADLIASEYAEVLEILEPDVTFEMVGGHDRAKQFLQERVLNTLRDPDLHDVCPMGLMFAGPAGTGKTWVARAIAHETGLNCVELQADKIKGQYVGESEKKLRKALTGIEALAPCVVFIDELDQKVKRVVGGGGGGGDSVEGNTFGELLKFFSNDKHRGKILLIAATNRPDQIDAAFKRPGRIDYTIPLLPPDSASERAAAVAALCRRKRVPMPSDAELLAIGEATDLWTPAELEALVGEAGYRVRLRLMPETDGDDRSVSARAFEAGLDDMVRSTADVELHTDLAVRACNFRSLVPERYRDRVGKQQARAKTAARPQVGAARTAITDTDAFDAYDDEEV